MAVYPVFVELAGRRCLVVGGGVVGRRKAEGLLSAGAAVTVIEPRPGDELRAMARHATSLSLVERAFRDGDSAGAALVYACADKPDVNAAVAADAKAAGAPCCRADDGAASDFTAGAVLRRGAVCVAVSTGRSSPRLAVRVRDRIAASGAVDDALAEEAGGPPGRGAGQGTIDGTIEGTTEGTGAGTTEATSEGAGRCIR